MNRPVLPLYYYHDHFREMLAHVHETYGSVLAGEHRVFMATFEALGKDAQCLYIRMVNRRGTIFRTDDFRYTEILDVKAALDELRRTGLARSLCTRDHAGFIAFHPKAALIKLGRDEGLRDIRSSWARSKLIAHVVSAISFEAAYARCHGDGFVALGDTAPLEFLLYLYFGKTQDDLKTFALRDLGILHTRKAAALSARFTDGHEARACFHYSRLLDRLDIGDGDRHAAIALVQDGPPCTTDYARELRGRAAFKLGFLLEKAGEPALAMSLYRCGASAECNERLVRLLYADGEKTAAQDLLQRMIDDPASDDEFLFASDFFARKFGGRRTGACTNLLRDAITVTVDDTWRGNPEAGVAGALRRQGHTVYFTENALWRCLFGLLFWDQLFESGQLGSGFDRVPHCLTNRTFAKLFSAEIDATLGAVESGDGMPLVTRTIAAHWGKFNGIFGWDWIEIDALRLLLTTEPKAASSMLRLMSRDFAAMRDGFPDLMTEKDGTIAFIEVKAEGDVVRRNQLTRLRQLAAAGLSATIARVDFRFDSEQDYVVVDIETTGSWSNGDRITEIGAVKIRNHQVIGEWHSLINPQRPIPANITRLTGITNDMVRDAPLFADIADNFMAFMGDAIFVAHSVNFDYGFIAREYERLERRFRFPKLCTYAGMRRRFPGHKSYGLGALSAAYNISLENHHRALCDARAAAHLLNLMNAKRADEAPPVTGDPERDVVLDVA